MGRTVLYRASNAALDQEFDLILNNQHQQTLPTDSLAFGLWQVSLDFSVDTLSYFLEQPLEIF